MAIERTLSMIKPDAVANNVIGGIYSMFEQNELKVIAAKMMHLSRERAEAFYAEHRERHFFGPLVEFMTSGPVMVQVLEGENAIASYRELMGATDPAKAEPGTIRHAFAKVEPDSKVQKNAVHGSDSAETAKREIDFFFKPDEIHSSNG